MVVKTALAVMAVSTAGSTSTASSGPPSDELSTGTKAGIGTGVGLVVLIAILVATLYVLKRRKCNENVDPAMYLNVNKKIVDYNPHRRETAELQAVQHSLYGSPKFAGSLLSKKSSAFMPQEQIHEIDRYARYEK